MEKCCRLVAAFGTTPEKPVLMTTYSAALPGCKEMISVLKNCPGVGPGKIIQKRTNSDEGNLER